MPPRREEPYPCVGHALRGVDPVHLGVQLRDVLAELLGDRLRALDALIDVVEPRGEAVEP